MTVAELITALQKIPGHYIVESGLEHTYNCGMRHTGAVYLVTTGHERDDFAPGDVIDYKKLDIYDVHAYDPKENT